MSIAEKRRAASKKMGQKSDFKTLPHNGLNDGARPTFQILWKLLINVFAVQNNYKSQGFRVF